MDTISISQLKINPAKAISRSKDFPLAVEKRNKVEAYLLGKELYDKLVSVLEDFADMEAVGSTDFSKGRDFEKVARSLNI